MRCYNWSSLSTEEKRLLLSRPSIENDDAIVAKTKSILAQVKADGDAALTAFTKQFDGVNLTQFQVSETELNNAFQQMSSEVKAVIEFAKAQLECYQAAQMPTNLQIETCDGIRCEREVRPIPAVGLYVPGGQAPLVSTVLMLAVPAQLAGCHQRILCTPPDKEGGINPYILVAAQLCGINKIYKLGGAQAIAAMAYGTQSVPKVDKIFGPGSLWVTTAKCIVANDIRGPAIDLPAGPSEVVVVADELANPILVAADLLSQAEHGHDSQVMLMTTSEELALRVQQEINAQLNYLPRADIARQSLQHSCVFIVEDLEQAIDIVNAYAPEHLILQVKTPAMWQSKILNSGAVFMGAWTPETLGDYVTGSNHVLPTSGSARYTSGLSVLDFVKFIHFQTATCNGFKKLAPYAKTLAEIEGLMGHKQAVGLRLGDAQ